MGTIPAAIAKAAGIGPSMLWEQAHSGAFATPPEGGALDPETRTLVYLAAALASSNHACTSAVANKARVQDIGDEKLLGPSTSLARIGDHGGRRCRAAVPQAHHRTRVNNRCERRATDIDQRKGRSGASHVGLKCPSNRLEDPPDSGAPDPA